MYFKIFFLSGLQQFIFVTTSAQINQVIHEMMNPAGTQFENMGEITYASLFISTLEVGIRYTDYDNVRQWIDPTTLSFMEWPVI